MTFGELQTSLSAKVGTTETINFTTEKRNKAINDAIQKDVIEFDNWKILEISKPITFKVKARLICGVTPLTTYTNWTSITNGSFRITIDGTAYNIDGINFSACTTMATVASTIQTAIRTATSGSETVNVYPASAPDYFVIASGTTGSTSNITILSTSTGTVGTDISGVNYLNADSTTHANITKWNTASLPLNYDEMVDPYILSNQTKTLEYVWKNPSDFDNSSYSFTIQDLFGTQTLFLSDTSDITLFCRYRQKVPLLTDTADDALFPTSFEEPITLLAAARLLSYSNFSDARIARFKADALETLGSLRRGDKKTSTRTMKRVRRTKTYKDPYGYGNNNTYITY